MARMSENSWTLQTAKFKYNKSNFQYVIVIIHNAILSDANFDSANIQARTMAKIACKLYRDMIGVHE